MSRHLRRAQLIEHAQANGLDGVLVHSWHRQTVGWLTGYSPGYVTNAASLWLGARGEQRLGIRFGFDRPRAALTGLPVIEAATPIAVVPEGVRRLGLVAGDSAVDETTPALLTLLQAAGIEHIDLRNVVDDLQESKLEDEIMALQHAGDVANAALVTWGDAAPEGKTDYQVAAAVEAAARAAGARRAYCLVGVGPGAVVSECFGTVIGAHDAVGLELTMYVDEWCMHVNTQLNAAQGTEHDAQRVCASARAAMLASMRPGVAIDDVVAVGDRALAAAGLLEAKEYDFGHGIAADTPAHPRLISGTRRVLAEHSVMALHAAVRVPGGATGFVGGPVVVEASGARELNPSAQWAILTRAAD